MDRFFKKHGMRSIPKDWAYYCNYDSGDKRRKRLPPPKIKGYEILGEYHEVEE